MAYTSTEARVQMLDDMARAVDELGVAIACLTEAYESLDEDRADALEEHIFRPVQLAYGRLKRAHAEFASRYGLSSRHFGEVSPGTHTADPRVYLQRAVEAAEGAEQRLAELQDSMLPVEVGDTDLRAGLADTRAHLAEVPAQGDRVLRTLGR